MQIILSSFRLTIVMSKFLRRLAEFFILCHGNAKLAPKHLTKIVIENIAVFGRLVLALNDTHWLAWIIQQLFYVSLCEYSILFLNLSTFLLSLILAHDRDHGFSCLSIAFTSATAVLMVYLPHKMIPKKWSKN